MELFTSSTLQIRPTRGKGEFSALVHSALSHYHSDKRIDKAILNMYVKSHLNDTLNLDFGESVL